MATRRGRYSFQQPTFDAGDVVVHSNLEQASPGTVLTGCAGKAITFQHCKLLNVSIDPAWTVEDCNTDQRTLCPNNNPDLVALGVLVAEPEACPHVLDTDEATIDGVTHTIYTYWDPPA